MTPKNYFLLATLWILWCTVHSAMISVTVTKWLKHRLENRFRFYRLFFNCVAAVTLIPVVGYGYSIKGEAVLRWEGFAVFIQIFLLAISAGLFWAGAQQYDTLQFLGLRQIKTESSCSALTETCKLNTSGILSITRHPWYLATMLLIWTHQRSMDASALIANAMLSVYLVVGTLLEERKLVMEYGEEYRQYQQKVSMLLPFKHFASYIF